MSGFFPVARYIMAQMNTTFCVVYAKKKKTKNIENQIVCKKSYCLGIFLNFVVSSLFFFLFVTQKLCLLELVSLLTHFHSRAFDIIDMNVKIHVVIHCTYVLTNMYSKQQKI